MKLLIISHTPHYLRGKQVVGWGPTIREIDILASQFDSIVHIAPLHQESAPESSLAYTASNITFRPVKPAGGESLRSKLSIIARIPEYISVIHQEMTQTEMIHVRCPAAISLIALFILIFSRSPKYRWVKYAGNWKPAGREAFSYTLQRWILEKNLHRGVVTINGSWMGQPYHIHSFYNPCLTDDEYSSAGKLALEKELKPPYRFLFVGRLDSAKGVGRILRICAKLKEKEIPFQLDLVGDGPEKNEFIHLANELHIQEFVHFAGWLPRPALSEVYSRAQFILFPSSSSEGWPKVLSEAMAYGVVPIASNVSSIPQILEATKAGLAFPPDAIDLFAQGIEDIIACPSLWKEMSLAGMHAADQFTYTHYLTAVRDLLKKAWNIDLLPPASLKSNL